MGLTLYGSPLTAAGRCYLVLEEIGLPYAAVPLDPIKKEARTTYRDYRKPCPFAQHRIFGVDQR
jgi:glutathione S-transferase